MAAAMGVFGELLTRSDSRPQCARLDGVEVARDQTVGLPVRARGARHRRVVRLGFTTKPTSQGEPTKAFRHICWDGCMFSNDIMLDPQIWNDDVASMIAE